MKTISLEDEVVISLALRSEIRVYVKTAKLVGQSGGNITPFILEIKDLIHAYNAVNIVPFKSDDPFLRFFL